ncbi:hemin uptake protein HemP [Octadecabacter sp. G9-8]|uniref:Hemin uptake protein HemP n=1 Tax=Octadecabacter dasysiphoniae TaxID=2909341 RepID=A0ABS9CXX9_9RHOB|nr:hemin uptake protein HemP [Octadecabacter dasysiphoniae]MCF2872029.1 hemin uptake protein HemP [Octadecabacter dasysiphoniae]
MYTPTKTENASHTPAYDAREMTDADGKALITLDGQVYTLRITRLGKLILTK